MDIDLLSKMVKELIMDNDQVSLPGLGTFVAETVPSAFSDKGFTINPPYRKLSFRPVREKDTLLVDLYASANGVSQEIAEKALTVFIDGLREVLQSRKNILFPGLGRLRATKENNFFFVADENLDIYPEGFGLAPLSLKSHTETPEEVSAAIDALKMMVDEVALDGPVADQPETPADADVPLEEEQVAEGYAETDELSESSEIVPALSVGEIDGIDEIKEDVQAESEVGESSRKPEWLKYLYLAFIVLLSLLLLIVIYVVVARVFPDFIDSILYNSEEYDLLHRL